MESAAIPFSTAMKETSKGEGLVYVTSIAVHAVANDDATTQGF